MLRRQYTDYENRQRMIPGGGTPTYATTQLPARPADNPGMRTDPLSVCLLLAALRCLRGWRPEHCLPEALEHPGAWRPRVRA